MRKDVPAGQVRAVQGESESAKAGRGALRQQRERPWGSLSADIRQTPAE